MEEGQARGEKLGNRDFASLLKSMARQLEVSIPRIQHAAMFALNSQDREEIAAANQAIVTFQLALLETSKQLSQLSQELHFAGTSRAKCIPIAKERPKKKPLGVRMAFAGVVMEEGPVIVRVIESPAAFWVEEGFGVFRSLTIARKFADGMNKRLGISAREVEEIVRRATAAPVPHDRSA